MASPIRVGGAGEEGGEFLMDGGGQAVALKRLHEPHADDALILTGHNPQRIGIGTGADAHGLHLPGNTMAFLWLMAAMPIFILSVIWSINEVWAWLERRKKKPKQRA